jgi:MFS family permease
MQQVLHYSALQAGIAWLATSLASIAFAGLAQLLVTRGSAKVVMAIGMTLIAAGVLWVQEHQAGLASGLLNTSQQIGGAIGIAIASSVAAGHTTTLLDAGDAAPTALTGGFQAAFWVLGAIALVAVPAIFALVRRDELSAPKTAIRPAEPALADAN